MYTIHNHDEAQALAYSNLTGCMFDTQREAIRAARDTGASVYFPATIDGSHQAIVAVKRNRVQSLAMTNSSSVARGAIRQYWWVMAY